MVQILPGVFGRKPVVDLNYCVARARELTLAIAAAKTHLETMESDLREVETLAAKEGLAKQLAKALAPPPAVEAVPMTRIKALKPFKALFRGPYGAEEYSGAPGTVNDVPTALLAALKGRVTPVAADAEIIGIPLQPGMLTDD